ncbi:GntR family transcriptional regulator [Bifidobacterium cuniculi]|uniref:GntR family transcriptional regulator n=1 Tax=Bifidobacterium cuniculi TaxID=1688 RepID=A0A087AYB2_9BIFI|nr:GntR family transcriptional regulator [Bifidobacterium cuniculi]KFI63762.1 GntR family transcriptional regulator [Bifidobacterium cuniculi]
MSGSVTQRTVERLRALIESGCLPPPGRLPSERRLAADLHVSRSTVRNALQILREAGEVSVRSGRAGGTFVATANPDANLYARADISIGDHRLIEHATGLPQGIPETVASQGFRTVTYVKRIDVRTPDTIAARRLALEEGEPVLRAERVRAVGGHPVAHETAYLPYRRYPGIEHADFTQSVYSIITERYGTMIGHVIESIDIRMANENEAATLDVPAGSPLIFSESVAHDADGIPAEYSRDRFRPDRVRIVAEHTFPQPSNQPIETQGHMNTQ